MNFEQLQQAYRNYDEVMPIGKTVELEGKAYHIVGMTRLGKQAELYIIESAPENDRMEDYAAEGGGPGTSEKEHDVCRGERYTNRAGMKIAPVECLFYHIRTIRFGELELETGGADSGPLSLNAGCAVDADCENLLFFHEMRRAGWTLAKDSPFWTMDWNGIWRTRLSFQTEVEKLPVLGRQDISIKWGRRVKPHYVEKPVRLIVGAEMELPFTTKEGRQGICYINQVYPIDVWKENEEKFRNPRYLEMMSAEELEKQKKDFFRNLEQACPQGMCYLGIEYECTLEGSLAFYDRAFLNAAPETHQGSFSVMMMLLRPDEAIGKHGLQQRGCVIQTPFAPDVREVDAELFRFDEIFGEGEGFVPLAEVRQKV